MPTFTGINMILDMHKLTRTLIFSYDFLRFSTFSHSYSNREKGPNLNKATERKEPIWRKKLQNKIKQLRKGFSKQLRKLAM